MINSPPPPDHLLLSPGHRPWCLRCRRPGVVCLCAAITPRWTRTRFVLLTHPKEARRTRNGTGRMSHLSLPHSETLVGVDFRAHPRVTALLEDPGLDCRLLYPSSGPPALPTPASAATRPLVLFVLDGTWPCAKKMMRLSTNLHGLPRLGPPPGALSEFHTKQQPHPACLSTIEALDRTLALLADAGLEEPLPGASDRLLAPFRLMVQLGLDHAAAPGAKSYRASGPYKAPAERRRSRAKAKSGRKVVYTEEAAANLTP